MCEYCEKNYSNKYLLHSFGDYISEINGNFLNLRIYGHEQDMFDEDRIDSIKINYCPMCGRELVNKGE